MVTFTVTTTNPEYSKILADEVTSYFGVYINDFMKSDSIRTMQAKLGEVNPNPSNIHTVRNAALAAIIGAIVAAAILVIIFMFDDKIKTADDIERYLKVSVLGVIPEIDVEQ
jgi:capsular polysaccharide biosynthesis protein